MRPQNGNPPRRLPRGRQIGETGAGCVDFHLSADPLEQDRINVYEQWQSVAHIEAFRGSGPSQEQATAIRDAEVFQHEIASLEQL